MKQNKYIYYLILTFILSIMFTTSCKKPNNVVDDEIYYDVTFLHDGEVIKTIEVKEGEAAIAPNAPEVVGYSFVSWDKDFSCVEDDMEINAIYEINTYTVKFIINGTILKEVKVNYGGYAIAPIIEMDAYVYFNWDKDYSHVTSDMEINAEYEIMKYRVTYYGLNNEKIKTELVEYGKDAKGPTINEYTYDLYDFLGWDQEAKNVKSNLSIKGIYRKNTLTIDYYVDGIKQDLQPSTYKLGESLDLPVIEIENAIFIGWYLSDMSFTKYTKIDEDSDTSYEFHARYIEKSRKENIVLPDAKYHFTQITNADTINPKLPKEAIEQSVQSYIWTSSDTKVATISDWSSIAVVSSGFCIITATQKTNRNIKINCIIKTTIDGVYISNEEEANTIILHNVSFTDKNGEIIDSQKVYDGSFAIAPTPKTYDGLKFVGWDKELYNIKEDTVINPIYQNGENEYVGKKIAIIGDSISTYRSYIPSHFSAFFPYYFGKVRDINQTWWMRSINNLGAHLFVNNSWGGSCVSTDTDSGTKTDTRLSYTVINEQKPDVILIYMGTNDCMIANITVRQFRESYPIMIEKLKKLCPDSQIILMNLFTASYTSQKNLQNFNDVINSNASKYNLKLIDLSKINLDGSLIDSVHPNLSGMNMISDVVCDTLLNK